MEAFAPAPPANLPWSWEKRRPMVLDNEGTRGVKTWAAPIGYLTVDECAPHSELDWSSAKARQDELKRLIKTQWLDLPPIADELAENGINVLRLDSPVGESADETHGDYLTGADVRDHEIVYEQPDRRELWLMEQDEQRWYTGPVIKMQFVVKDGKMTIDIPRGLALSPERIQQWVLHVIKELTRDGQLPTVEELDGRMEEIAFRRATYGPEWSKSLLPPKELDGYDQLKRHFSWFVEQESGFRRNDFSAQDEGDRLNKDRVGYAGGEHLGVEWDEYGAPNDTPWWEDVLHNMENWFDPTDPEATY